MHTHTHVQLSMDFEEELNKILAVLPSGADRRTYLFSATMTSKVAKLQRASLTKPVKVPIGLEGIGLESIGHRPGGLAQGSTKATFLHHILPFEKTEIEIEIEIN